MIRTIPGIAGVDIYRMSAEGKAVRALGTRCSSVGNNLKTPLRSSPRTSPRAKRQRHVLERTKNHLSLKEETQNEWAAERSQI